MAMLVYQRVNDINGFSLPLKKKNVSIGFVASPFLKKRRSLTRKNEVVLVSFIWYFRRV